MRLPNVAGILSDATKLKWSDLDQTQSQLKELAAVTDDFADLSNWTESDSGSNVNLVGAVVEMNGSNAWGANGLVLTGGVVRAEGYFEIKALVEASVAGGFAINVSSTSALPPTGVGAVNYFIAPTVGNVMVLYDGVLALSTNIPMTPNTWYTFRVRIGKADDGSTWKRIKITIQGASDYLTETVLHEANWAATAHGNPAYFSIQRYTNNGGALAKFKEFRWYSNYDTGGPYSQYVHDAGSGKMFDNFDPTSLAMPGAVVDTNLKFAWSFDDGTPTYSAWLTLAQLNAVSKQIANKRYIRLRVQNNSDGATQAYGAEPNADNATNGTGAPLPTPGVPVGQIIQAFNTSLLIQSSFVQNASGIKVFRDTDPGGAFPEITGSPFASYEILDDNNGAGLAENTPYYYKLKGTNSAGDSGFSTIFASRTIIGKAHPRTAIRDKAVLMLTDKVSFDGKIIGVHKTRFLPYFPGELPAIGVYILDEPADDEETAPREYARLPQLMIEICLKKNHIENSDDITDYIAKQVEDLFFIDNTMGDLVDDLKLRNTKLTPKIDGEDLYMGATMDWEIKYRTDAPEEQGAPLVEDLEKSFTQIGVGHDETPVDEHAIEAEIDHET